MSLANFDELIKSIRNNRFMKRIAVVAAEDENALEAVFTAEDFVSPVFIGNAGKIGSLITKLGRNPQEYNIVEADSDTNPAKVAVDLINQGEVDLVMKGKIETATLLKELVNRDYKMRTETLMSHVAIFEIATYHKLLVITDGGMVIQPDLDQKKQIIQNAVSTLTKLGYDTPKAAVLTAVEKVNPKMPETVHAAELQKMNEAGELAGCVVEGPVSYDLAMSKKSAKLKEYESPHTGEFDILLVPNMTCGNILSKAMMYNAGAKMAGIVVGAQVPVVLTSRGASAEEKYLSLILSAGAA